MATGRMLQKRISNSRKMALLTSDGARLLYTWMLSHLDVNGCFFGDPVMINNIVFTRLGKSAKEIQRYLDELEEVGCIVRYKGDDGEDYLYYPDFMEKQTGLRPEREGNSDIPQPTAEQCRSNAGVIPLEGEEKVKGRRREGNGNPSGVTSDCPHVEIVELYHRTLPELVKVVEWNPARKSLLRSRWKESKARQCLPWWEEYFRRVAKSDFLMGRVNGGNGRAPFKADLEWLIRPMNLVKVIEGKYDNRNGNGKSMKTGLEDWMNLPDEQDVPL